MRNIITLSGIITLSVLTTFQCGVLCDTSCIVRSSETFISLSEVRSVKLLGLVSQDTVNAATDLLKY